MSEIADRYERLADAFAATIAAVPADAWESPTPCSEWNVRELVEHVCSIHGLFLGFIDEPAGAGPEVADDPGGAFAAASAPVRAALHDTRAAKTFQGLFGETSFAEAIDGFANFDLVVHRWDLARAMGSDATIADADAERVLDGAARFGPALYGDGVCKPALDVPADADLTTRMLAVLGRRA